MYVTPSRAAINEMGYAFSRLEIDSDLCDGGKTVNEADGSRRPPQNYLDHEIAQITRLKSGAHERLSKVVPGKREGSISTVKMLAGREYNCSGRGRFTSGDCCNVLSRYLPVNGPSLMDQMTSRAYVSQFSADGSLFVAGFQVYASMSPIVHIVNVGAYETESLANVTDIHEGLDFSTKEGYNFGIFSLKYSTDGRELVAGSSNDSIYVYDLGANKLSLLILAHTVWDRRCFTARGKPAGVLVGHLEGITFINSREDGRYFISNGKDQKIKLWDIRKMSCNATGHLGPRSYKWDYRWMDYPLHAKDSKHPFDQSVATYRGHSVLQTLIRCYFSPAYSTGQKYIYTGSHDSCVYIYDLASTAQIATLKHRKSPVRDCSWHPYYPILVSSS